MHLSEIVESPDYVRFCEGRLVDPYPFFQVLREHDPVHWSEQLSAWVLTRYDDVAAAIAALISQKSGNYLAFFSSYHYM